MLIRAHLINSGNVLLGWLLCEEGIDVIDFGGAFFIRRVGDEGLHRVYDQAGKREMLVTNRLENSVFERCVA